MDVICKFCGYLAQVKATRLQGDLADPPLRVPGAAWEPQHQRIIAGIFHALYIVGFKPDGQSLVRIDFVPPHILQASPEVYEPRSKLSATAKRAGWQGYRLNLEKVPPIGIKRVHPV